MEWLWEPWGYEFFVNALVTGWIIGVLCPVVGTFLVVLRLSLLGDAIAHAVIPGVAIANSLGWDLTIGAFGAGMTSACVASWLERQGRVRADSAVALSFASFFSLGIILISLFKTRVDLEGLLFGDVLSVTYWDMGQAAIATVVILTLLVLHYKEILFFTFDPVGAAAAGLPTEILQYALMAAVTLAVVAAMKIAGTILVVALLVGPAVTASLWVRSLGRTLALAACFGVIGCTVGIHLSYYFDLPSGPAIALTLFAQFFLSWLATTRPGRA
ncbi:MAG: metal ABC transporter permease [Cyanobacteria bacterium P01_D01_bin.73]